MSRIGKLPVNVPAGVDVKISGSHVKIKGPKGELGHVFPAAMKIAVDENVISVNRPSDSREHRALHGMTRALIFNMVTGVSQGYEKVLQVEGVGYRSEMDGQSLVLNVGYSHPVVIEPPEGISFEVDTRGREIRVMGHNKQVVGQITANIRKVRPPEPYKGKGIRYKGEEIRRKAGKAGKK
jgi:large subunit ribosomal protein L6